VVKTLQLGLYLTTTVFKTHHSSAGGLILTPHFNLEAGSFYFAFSKRLDLATTLQFEAGHLQDPLVGGWTSLFFFRNWISPPLCIWRLDLSTFTTGGWNLPLLFNWKLGFTTALQLELGLIITIST
jgi:hypothetical protein